SPILLLYSFSTIRCPPHTSTLSPYTTLFRSKIRNVKYPSHRLFMRDARRPFLCVNGIRFSGIVLSDPTVNFVPERDLPETDRQVDRKSTRLNSSHQIISYAVFCLKKKK